MLIHQYYLYRDIARKVSHLGPTKIAEDAIITYISSAAYFRDVLLAFMEELQDENRNIEHPRSPRIDYHFALAPQYAFTSEAQSEYLPKIKRTWEDFRNYNEYAPVIERTSYIVVTQL